MTIAIPTYKRAHCLKGKDYFKDAVYVLPESQKDDYLKNLPIKRMVVIPDSEDGNIARKRNWILRNMPRPVLMIDDDVRGLETTEKRDGERVKRHIKIAKDNAIQIISNGFNLAREWECVLWGINVNVAGMYYQQYRPFSLSQVVLGPFQGHLQHDLFYDEDMGTKDDYDFSLQVLEKTKKVLRINKYSYDCEHGDNAGGIVAGRSMDREIAYCEAIMRKWGKKVIKYEIPPKKKTDLLNGRVNVPIEGV